MLCLPKRASAASVSSICSAICGSVSSGMCGWSYEWSPNSMSGLDASSSIASGWPSTQRPDTKIVAGTPSRFSVSKIGRSNSYRWLCVAHASNVSATALSSIRT